MNVQLEQILELIKTENRVATAEGHDPGIKIKVAGYISGEGTGWLRINRDDIIEWGRLLDQEKFEEFKNGISQDLIDDLKQNTPELMAEINGGSYTQAIKEMRKLHEDLSLREAKAFVDRIRSSV